MNEVILNIIGLIAATLTTFSAVPQVAYVARTHKTRDLSLLWLLSLVLGCFVWVVYGIGRSDFVLILSCTIAFMLNFYMLVIKMINQRIRKTGQENAS